MACRRGYYRGSARVAASSDRYLSSTATSPATFEVAIKSKTRQQQHYRPPTGVRGYKAWRIVRENQQAHQRELPTLSVNENCNNDTTVSNNSNTGKSNSSGGGDGASLQSIGGKFARPLQPVPGDASVEQHSWNDLTTAPVSMQVLQILGIQDPSSGYSSEDYKEQPELGNIIAKPSNSDLVSCSSSTLSLAISFATSVNELTYLENENLKSSSTSSLDTNPEDKYCGIIHFNLASLSPPKKSRKKVRSCSSIVADSFTTYNTPEKDKCRQSSSSSLAKMLDLDFPVAEVSAFCLVDIQNLSVSNQHLSGQASTLAARKEDNIIQQSFSSEIVSNASCEMKQTSNTCMIEPKNTDTCLASKFIVGNNSLNANGRWITSENANDNGITSGNVNGNGTTSGNDNATTSENATTGTSSGSRTAYKKSFVKTTFCLRSLNPSLNEDISSYHVTNGPPDITSKYHFPALSLVHK